MTILSRSNNPLKEMIMKRNSFLKLGLIGLLALAISGCNGFEEQKLPDEKVSPDEPFSIIVSPETKTQMSGDNDVVWKDDDAITVFVASKGSSAFSKNYKFERKTTGDVNSFYCNDFVGVLDAQNDWYVFYPYTATIGTPKNNSVSVIVGSAADGRQTQAGNSSRAHLAGDNIPLYGKGTFAAGVVPKINLNQALSVIKVHVTNNTANDLTVSSVSFTAPDAIVGSFAIDFSGSNPAFTPEEGDNMVSATATLTVNNGAAITKGESADFYLAIKPFTVNAGGELVLTVNGERRTLTVPEGGVSFESGLIKTLNFYEMPIPDGNYLILAKNNSNYYALKAEETQNDQMVSVDYNGDLSPFYGDADMIWSVTRSGASYIIQNDGKYLGWTGGSNNKARFQEPGESWSSDNYLLDIVVTDNTDIYNVVNHKTPARYLSRNTSNEFFAFYGNTNQYEEIIFVPATVDNRTPVTLSFAEESINKTTSNYSEFKGQTPTATADEQEVTGLTFTYAIEGDDIGSVVETTGAVTLNGTTGSATVTATFAGDETYRPASEVSYTITVTDGTTPPTPTTGWFETSLASLTSSDVFVIVGNDTYTISNAQSTSAAPAAATLASASVTISGTTPNRSLSGTIPDGVKWKLTGNSTDGYTFYSNANSSYHLYNSTTAESKSNDAMRVGSPSSGTDRKLFILDGSNHLVTNDSYTARYLACYTSNPDWRGYINSSTSETTITFYKYVAAPDDREEAGMSWSAESATATYTTVNNASSLAFTAPTLTVGNATGISYESTDETIATISNTGVVSVNLTDNSVKEGSTTIKAVFEGDEDYKPQTVGYTLTVVDNRTVATTPTFDPSAGEVTANQVVTFNPTNQGLTFHYTVDGTEPTVSSPTAASVTIDAAKTVKVLATKTGYKPSAVASAAYTIEGVVEAGTLSNPYTVAEAIAAYQANPSIGSKYVKGIVCQEGNSYCFISDDGTTDNKFELYSFSGDIVSSALKLGDAVIAHGTLAYYSKNDIYEINGTTVDVHISKPVLTPDGGDFVGSQSVSIASANSSSIRYTTDGTNPTITTGNVYSTSFNLTSTTTIKAIGIDANGLVCTGVTTANFTKVQTYAVTWDNPSNGTLVVKQGETTITSGTMVPENATINITATPADGYALSTLVYNDGSAHDIKSAKSFTMPSQAVTITATFEQSGGTPTEYTDILTASMFAATSTTYTDFSGVSYSGTNHSASVYAGNSAKDSNGNIQLRSKNSNSGIVSTTSGGKVKSIKITVGSGSNTIDVYGSSTAYSAASDLYGTSKGTKIGSVSATGTITVPDNVDYSFVGIRSNNGAVYITSIEITWED